LDEIHRSGSFETVQTAFDMDVIYIEMLCNALDVKLEELSPKSELIVP